MTAPKKNKEWLDLLHAQVNSTIWLQQRIDTLERKMADVMATLVDLKMLRHEMSAPTPKKRVAKRPAKKPRGPRP